MLKKVNKSVSINEKYKSKKSFIENKIILPKKGEIKFLLELNQISIFDFLVYVSFNEKIKSLDIISYRIAKKDLIFLEEMIKKSLIPKKTNLFISSSIPSLVVGVFNYLKNNRNFEVKYMDVHVKTCIITTDQNNYTLISSGNFNPDGKIEQIIILNQQKIAKDICRVVREI
jgi:hypothetical protein